MTQAVASERVGDRTIRDFGVQWTTYRSNEGYFGTVELLADFFDGVLDLREIRGKQVADIGSGTGRIVNMLIDAGAAHVLGVEPSSAYRVMLENTLCRGDRVTCLNVRGDQLPPSGELDFVFSVGVIHHIPEPDATIRAAYEALRPGGRIAIWVYGREGNELYLSIALPMRRITRRLPHDMLAALVRVLDVPLVAYIAACRRLPLPMRRYMTEVMGKLTPAKRRLGIYDQLNPAYARYYTRAEARDLLARAGFVDIRQAHRHGYSWSLVGTRPTDAEPPNETGE